MSIRLHIECRKTETELVSCFIYNIKQPIQIFILVVGIEEPLEISKYHRLAKIQNALVGRWLLTLLVVSVPDYAGDIGRLALWLLCWLAILVKRLAILIKTPFCKFGICFYADTRQLCKQIAQAVYISVKYVFVLTLLIGVRLVLEVVCSNIRVDNPAYLLGYLSLVFKRDYYRAVFQWRAFYLFDINI